LHRYLYPNPYRYPNLNIGIEYFEFGFESGKNVRIL
jgi:hypothetical protein